MNRNVLLIEPTIRPVGVDMLRENCAVTMAPDGKEETLIRYINEHDIAAVVTRVESITAELLRQCPSLVAVGQHGVGVDNVDVAEATRQGVAVINVPGANYMSVAEHAMMFVLALSRRLLRVDSEVRQNNWKVRDQLIPWEINGKNLLIIGMGRQGQELSRKAAAFHMRLLGFDPFVSSDDMALHGVEKVEELQKVLPLVDFVSIHVPLTPQTKHLIGEKELALMKPSANLINVGRGPVVDQKALVHALKTEQICGAGLDVLDIEPPDPQDEILTCSNVILTPHMGGDTLEAKDRCSRTLASDIIKTVGGQKPNGLVNMAVLSNARFLQK